MDVHVACPRRAPPAQALPLGSFKQRVRSRRTCGCTVRAARTVAMVSDAEITVLWVTYVSAEPADDGGMYMYSDLLAASHMLATSSCPRPASATVLSLRS